MQADRLTVIEELASPILEALAFELVDLELKNEGGLVLRLFIDKPGGITLDDCVAVSREIGAILEIEDPITSAYRLEVSSPGLDRPLKKAADFSRFAGQKARLKTLALLDPEQSGRPRKTFIGILRGIEGEMVQLELTDRPGGLVAIGLSQIDKANLVEEF